RRRVNVLAFYRLLFIGAGQRERTQNDRRKQVMAATRIVAGSRYNHRATLPSPSASTPTIPDLGSASCWRCSRLFESFEHALSHHRGITVGVRFLFLYSGCN